MKRLGVTDDVILVNKNVNARKAKLNVNEKYWREMDLNVNKANTTFLELRFKNEAGVNEMIII